MSVNDKVFEKLQFKYGIGRALATSIYTQLEFICKTFDVDLEDLHNIVALMAYLEADKL